MSGVLRAMRTVAAGALVALGMTATAGATYCGGASFRCGPAPVVATQCETVALRPAYTTTMQTVSRRCTRISRTP